MQKSTKKTLVIGGIVAGVALVGYLAYRQFLKALDFTIKPRSVKILNRTLNGINLLLGFGFENKSTMKFIVTKQEYDVYLNGILLTTFKSNTPQTIMPNATSPLQIELGLKYKDFANRLNVATGVSWIEKLENLANLRNQKLRLDAKISIKYGILPSIPIDYSKEDTFVNWGLKE
jgi:LEA14-like dessication related protein